MSAPLIQSRYLELDSVCPRFAQQGEQVQTLTQRVAQRAEVCARRQIAARRQGGVPG